MLLEQVCDTRTRRGGTDDPLTIVTLELLAQAYVGAGRAPDAIKLLEQVRDSRLKTLGPYHVESIGALNNLAFAHQAVGKMKQALALYEEARTVTVTKLGVNHPLTLNILDSLARTYRVFGKQDEAIALAEQVLATRMRDLGPNHPNTIQTLENLGLAYKAKGKPDEALRLYERAVAGLEQIDFMHGSAGRIVGNLCTCLEDLGRLGEAASWRRRWLAAAKEQFGAESAEYAGSLSEFGERLLLHEKYADAESILRECLDISRKTQPEAWTTYYAQSMLGESLLGRGKHPEAEPDLLQGYEGLKSRERQIPQLLARYRVAEALGRVVRLYEAWGKPKQAAHWRARMTLSGHAMPKP
jgi:tetratricopeptide (TPR) repeat protein